MKLARVLLLALAFCAVSVRGEDATAEVAEEGEEERVISDNFSPEERAVIGETQETHQFQAEVNRLMDILINSLYSNRDIFIRELISNAADACDKVRFQSLTQGGLLADGEEIGIKIHYDTEAKTITIQDEGVGMTKDDLIKNLGIVAKSGTSDFLDAAAQGSDSLSLIGQFGVGFYSVYLVADKVTVVSKHTSDDQYIWESKASSTFTVSKDPRGNTLGRGTAIILHLKEDAEEFMDETTLKGLVSRYSQFINFPISLETKTEVTREVEIEKEEAEATEEENEDVEVSEEEDEAAVPTTKTITEIETTWVVLNDAKPIWTRNPKDVTEEEYEEFYKTVTKDSQGPLDKIHFVAEGEITFRAILYVPKVADPAIYDRFYEKSTGLKLYVRRVMISDEFDDFLPHYLNFVKGIIDSDDLPLNVSRETLAQSRVLKVMSKKITRKVLELLRKIADRSEPTDEEEGEEADEKSDEETDYEIFWAQYSKSIKMGVMDDKKNKAKLVKLLRYQSTKSDGKLISFEDYVDRMKEDQNNIYFLTCENIEACLANPTLEKYVKRDIEVLFLDEAIDEYCSQHIHEFDGLEPENILRESSQPATSNAFKKLGESEDTTDLVNWFKKVLGSQVSKVFVSNKLVTSPAACTSPEYGWTGNMERIQRAAALQKQEDMASQTAKKIFEFNPFHPIIKEINERRKVNEDDPALLDMVHILFDSAAVMSGYTMEEPEMFAKRIHKVISLGLDIDPDAKVEVEPEEVEEVEEVEEAEEAVEDEAE